MPFNNKVREEALVKSHRYCCVCHEFAGRSINVHHIEQEADGGSNELSNAIVLCLRCHAEAGHFNSRHPLGTKYSPSELIKHRDAWWEACENGTEKFNTSVIVQSKRVFTSLDLHKHKLLIWVVNGNEKPITNWKLDIFIPEAIKVINTNVSHVGDLIQDRIQYNKYQVISNQTIFPGEESQIMNKDINTLEYHIDHRIYYMRRDLELQINWAFYSDTEQAIKGVLSWDEMQQF